MNTFLAVCFGLVAILTFFKVMNFEDNTLVILFCVLMSSVFIIRQEIRELKRGR